MKKEIGGFFEYPEILMQKESITSVFSQIVTKKERKWNQVFFDDGRQAIFYLILFFSKSCSLRSFP